MSNYQSPSIEDYDSQGLIDFRRRESKRHRQGAVQSSPPQTNPAMSNAPEIALPQHSAPNQTPPAQTPQPTPTAPPHGMFTLQALLSRNESLQSDAQSNLATLENNYKTWREEVIRQKEVYDRFWLERFNRTAEEAWLAELPTERLIVQSTEDRFRVDFDYDEVYGEIEEWEGKIKGEREGLR
ncbi:hypothetical protein EJ08DRAFT_701196 [Tothia fuscella]|uniref:Uncharacterized protein n=1 Tax=Tothia fuscella TaxID=1048955 RepID=A0A9P4TUF0_9PEZI|nr:hypothetical protein EJ08DRAFT_701196 [Tothia fuscella]